MDDIRILDQPITWSELQTAAEAGPFGDFVKAVVDLQRNIMAIGGEMHADEEAALLEHGSKQNDLWGINLHPSEMDEARVEFDSMINIRPTQGNRSRTVEDPDTRARIWNAVHMLIR